MSANITSQHFRNPRKSNEQLQKLLVNRIITNRNAHNLGLLDIGHNRRAVSNPYFYTKSFSLVTINLMPSDSSLNTMITYDTLDLHFHYKLVLLKHFDENAFRYSSVVLLNFFFSQPLLKKEIFLQPRLFRYKKKECKSNIYNKDLKQFLTRHIILSFIVMRSNIHINEIDVLVYFCILLVSFTLFIRLIMPNTIHHCREVKVAETCSYHNQLRTESNT